MSMRYRSTAAGAFSTARTRTYKQRSSCTGTWTVTSSETTYIGQTSLKEITDTVTPGFHALLECGRFLPLNPVDIKTTVTTRTEGNGDVYANYVSGCYRQWYSGPKYLYSPDSLFVPGLDETVMDSVVTAAVADARSAIFDSLTFMAEFDQVVDMVRDRLGRITDWGLKASDRARHRRRRRPKSKKELLEFFAQAWLEYAFGWSPLVHDVNDALEAFRRTTDGVLVDGRATQTVSLDDSKVSHINVSSSQDWTFTEVIDGERVYRGHAYATQSPLSRFGFDPITTGWEIVPWSFVIDYFINVGSWLQAVSPFSGAKLQGSMCSVKDTYSYTQFIDIAYFGTQSGSFTGASTKVEVERYQRFPRSVEFPGWNPRITPKRIINLVALALQGNSKVMRSLFR